MEYISDHAALATDRLAEQYRAKPQLVALLDNLNTETQTLEDALWQLLNERGVLSSVGAQLDVIGQLVNQPRAGLSDDEYRIWLSARVKLNIASGTVEELLEIFSLIKPTGTTLELRDEFPAAFTLKINSAAISADSAAVLLLFLRLARAAGVRGILEWTEVAPEDTFTLDGTAAQALDTGGFSGALV